MKLGCLIGLGSGFLHSCGQRVDAAELARPACVVKKLPQVMAVVVGGIGLSVVRGCERGHLVTIHGVVEEEFLDLS